MTTKERIIDQALTLFSIKGFRGTSVKNIADAVGIKDSSIYKHFASKRDIFDAIVAQMRERMAMMGATVGLPKGNGCEAARIYGAFSLEELQAVSRKAFLFYAQDEFMSRFWRLATMEQYQNQEIYEIYRHIFMEESISYQSGLFAEMIRLGIFREADPEVMAMSFYAPIFFLLSKYSGRTEQTDEALLILEKQVKAFYCAYRIEE